MLIRKQFKLSNNQWISAEILASIKHKINKLYVKYLKTKCPKQLEMCKKLWNKVTPEKEAVKLAYFENLFRNANNSTDTWKFVNNILRKSLKGDQKQKRQICWELTKILSVIRKKSAKPWISIS